MRINPKSLPILLLAACLAPMAAQAKPAWVKKAQDLGFKDIKNCQSCHAKGAMPTAKDPNLGDLGKWLADQKKAKKAAEVDLAWIKDYPKKG